MGALIRKLRWIGLEEEARRLELAISTVPSKSQCTGGAAGDRLATTVVNIARSLSTGGRLAPPEAFLARV